MRTYSIRLTGKVLNPEFKKLWVASVLLSFKIYRACRARDSPCEGRKKKARIIIKVNSVIEQSSIDALYRASNAGVKIDMIVRGICGLVPGVKGMSENITVRSIVGVYLEHSRIYYFENGGKPEVFAGSGDIMTRNMFKRIECIFPIEDADIKARICDEILDSMLKDNKFATFLHSNGAYYKRETPADEPPVLLPGALLRIEHNEGKRPRGVNSWERAQIFFPESRAAGLSLSSKNRHSGAPSLRLIYA